jgi:hypothetical protein
MNVTGVEKEQNVVSLFGGTHEEIIPDPLEELLRETKSLFVEEKELNQVKVPMVSGSQFPDQSMFILDQQLGHLKESIGRIKYYMLDLDDLLPK